MRSTKLNAVIAGGGLGGLATAIALAQNGWSVRVFERQPGLQTVGAGIYMWENGLRVLEALGAFAAATRGTHQGVAFQTRDRDNQLIERTEFPHSRLYSIPRDQLLNALAERAHAAGVEIVTGREAVGATPDGELLFGDGGREGADLALGVDGVGSKVRTALGLLTSHEVTEEGGIRLLVPASPADFSGPHGRDYVENWNGTRRLLVTPVGPTAIYLALTCMDGDVEAKRLPVNKDLWKAAFPAWSHLIDRITDRQGHWGLYSVVKCRAWSVGRTAILGDAAHAQTPNLGQGGAMAMQNGLGLAQALRQATGPNDIPGALAAWERRERPLIEHCQKWASLYGEVAHLPDDLRAQIFHGVAGNPWLSAQLTRAAASSPTNAAQGA